MSGERCQMSAARRQAWLHYWMSAAWKTAGTADPIANAKGTLKSRVEFDYRNSLPTPGGGGGGDGTQDVKTEKVAGAGRWGQAQQWCQGTRVTEMTGKGEEKARHHMGISDERGSENDRNRKRNLGTSQLYFQGGPPHSPPEKTILGRKRCRKCPFAP